MSYLTLIGFLALLTVSVWAQHTNPVQDNSAASGSVLKDLKQNHDMMNHSVEHKFGLQKPIFHKGHYLRLISKKRVKLTAEEKRVVRLLRTLGLLDNNMTAERVVESLREDTDLLKKLKKLLDEVDEKDETDDFYTAFCDLFFS